MWDRDIPPKLRDRTKTGPRARYSHNLLAHIHLSEFADRAGCEYNVTSPCLDLRTFPLQVGTQELSCEPWSIG